MAKGPKNNNNAKQTNVLNDRGSMTGQKAPADQNFDGQDISPAAKIMREIAKASMKADSKKTKYMGSKDESSPKSKTQTKSYKATTKNSVQTRPDTSVTQKFVEKSPESKKGSKS